MARRTSDAQSIMNVPVDDTDIGNGKVLAYNSVSGNLEYESVAGVGAPEGTEILSTGEVGGTKFLREDGDGTSSWQTVPSLSDGDKGDITVSASGATWTIDNEAVTLAKMANMATASLIYRKTAGAGVPEVQTLATLKTDLGLTGTNSGDQTTIAGITGTKAEFDTAVTDGNFMYVGDAPTAHAHEGTAILSTGEVGGTKFLREDGDGTSSWQTIAAGGDVSKVGTPADNQIGVWTGDGTIEGYAGFTFDTATDTLTIGVEAGSPLIKAPSAVTADTDGGSISIVAGNRTGTGTSGSLSLYSGEKTLAGENSASLILDGGTGGVSIQAYGTFSADASGDLSFGSDTTGAIRFINADTFTVPSAGDILFATSDGTDYKFKADSTVHGVLNFASVATTDKTFTFPNTTGTLALVTGTSDAVTVSTIELGHATDTTLSRSSAGVLAVEGVVVPTISSTNTLTNKRVTPRTGTTTSSATPTINTDNVDFYSITAQTEDITSFTTNLSGTPTEGQKLWIAITGTAARAITWGASFEASTVALPTTTVTTARLDVGFVWNSVTSKWRCIASA